jgi:choline dehydrogenase-like flavoprotein
VPIIDNLKLENDTILNADVCIVGAGMSGQIIASKIKNKKIIIIDSGDVNYNSTIQQLNDLDNRGLKLRTNHVNRVRQLGGSANLWANQLMLLEENEISKREWLDNNLEWPIDYNELKKNYEEIINEIFDKSLNNFDHFGFKKIEKYYSQLENEFINEKKLSFKKHFWPSKIEKFNINSKFTKKLINNNNINLITNLTATQLKINQESQIINEILIQSKGKKINVKSKVFVLSCGAIENAKIILNNSINYNILENANTGRYYMDHPRTTLGTLTTRNKFSLSSLFGIKFNSFDLRNSLKISNNHQITSKVLNCHAYLDPDFGDEDDKYFESILNEIKKIIKLSGIPNFLNFKNLSLKKLLELIYFKIPAQISNSYINNIIRIILSRKNNILSFSNIKINFQGEQFPNINSKIHLSNKKDIFGQNIPIMDWKLSEIDHQTQQEFIKIIEEMTNNHSYLSFKKNDSLEITDASHHSGTTRMSLSRSDGVVDKNSKFHDVKNLYISGNSIFRTIGSGNPGLTNMAMSNKLGKYLDKI